MPPYTLGHHESVLRSHRWRTAENSAAYLLPHLAPGQRILDVGCGPGTVTADLAAIVGGDGAVVGVDSAAAVVDLARSSAGDPLGNLRFEVADATALPLPDASFDVVHAHQVLQHLEDPVAALREMRRVVRPGGVVAVRDADYAAMAWYPQDAELDRWLALYRTVARSNGAEPDAGRRLLAWTQQAGFSDPEPSASAWCFATPQDRQWWGGLQADRITDSAVADQARTSGLADTATLAAMADAWRRWAAADGGWFVVVHGEVVWRKEEAER